MGSLNVTKCHGNKAHFAMSNWSDFGLGRYGHKGYNAPKRAAYTGGYQIATIPGLHPGDLQGGQIVSGRTQVAAPKAGYTLSKPPGESMVGSSVAYSGPY